jgi:hypothetical protein
MFPSKKVKDSISIDRKGRFEANTVWVRRTLCARRPSRATAEKLYLLLLAKGLFSNINPRL